MGNDMKWEDTENHMVKPHAETSEVDEDTAYEKSKQRELDDDALAKHVAKGLVKLSIDDLIKTLGDIGKGSKT